MSGNRPLASLLVPVIAIAVGAAWSGGEMRGQEPFDAEGLARRSGCLECHSVDEKVIGPPYRAVAARYRSVENARTVLVERVLYGAKGNWTEVTGGAPMPAHAPRLSEDDVRRLVDWVLSLEPADEGGRR